MSGNKAKYAVIYSASHSNDELYNKKGSKFENSSYVDVKNSEKLIAASYPTGCNANFCYNCKRENSSNESNDESYSPPPGIGFTFRGVICR